MAPRGRRRLPGGRGDTVLEGGGPGARPTRPADASMQERVSKIDSGFCRLLLDGIQLEEAEPDALAYLDFPPTHWKRLRTNNVQERTNRGIKRRSRVVQVFPSTGSLVRLAGAVMCEQDVDVAGVQVLLGGEDKRAL